MRIQKRNLGYRRTRFSTAVEHKIEQAIEKECKRYDVSRSFVIANALAFTFKIEVDDYLITSRDRTVVKFRKHKAS